MVILKNYPPFIFPALACLLLWMTMSGTARSQPVPIAGLTLTDIRTGSSWVVSTGVDSATAFVFLSPECPLCQLYTKTLNELSAKYQSQIRFIGIFPGNSYSREEILAFASKYQLQIPIFSDPDFSATKALDVTITPTAVFVKHSRLLYFGAIDNWASDLGKKRTLITERYLADAIDQSLSHQIVTVARTEPIGCVLNMY